MPSVAPLGQRQGEIGAEARASSLGHLACRFRADGAVTFERRGAHAEQLDLHRVGVADDAAQQEVARWVLGEPGAHEAAGA